MAAAGPSRDRVSGSESEHERSDSDGSGVENQGPERQVDLRVTLPGMVQLSQLSVMDQAVVDVASVGLAAIPVPPLAGPRAYEIDRLGTGRRRSGRRVPGFGETAPAAG
jgi:hypothetical protein